MAMIRTISPIPQVYSELAEVILNKLPKGYFRIDIVADTYKKESIKNQERILRGESNKVIISSSSSRIPRNFNVFLNNGDNKTRLIEVIKGYLIENRAQVLTKLGCQVIYFANDNDCYKVTLENFTK